MTGSAPVRARIDKLLEKLARWRERVNWARRTGMPLPFRRRRQAALLNALEQAWSGGFVKTDSGHLIYLPQRFDHQSLRILFGSEPAPPAILRRIPPGGVAIDVGANLGEWTVALAEQAGPSGQVLAFEPKPAVAEALAQTLRANGLRQVALHRCALSSKEGTATLAIHGTNSGESRLGAAVAGEASVQVPIRTLDRIVTEAGLSRVDLLKIDVEGHERDVLMGAAGVLERFRPTLVIETGHESADDRKAIADLIEQARYELVAALLSRGALAASLTDYRNRTGALAQPGPANLLLVPRDSDARGSAH